MFRLTSLFDLTGKTALVTGGNSGIGLAMARALGLAGAHLVIVARREDALREAAEGLQAEGIAAEIIAADLASPEAGTTLAAACERLGRTIDILVNVAGLNLRQPFMQVSAEAFDLHMAVHLRAPFLLTQAFAPGMAQRGYGRIVNIASLQSYRAFPDCAPYGADAGHRRGMVAPWRHLQRDRAGLLPDAADGARLRRPCTRRQKRGADRHRSQWRTRRSRRRHGLPGLARLGLCHRPDAGRRWRLHRQMRRVAA